MSDTSKPESVFQFPCDFTIKVFGKASDQFEMEVLTIIRKHVESLRENALASRLSKDGKYLALSVTVMARDKEQLDDIYRDLTANPLVLMAL